MTKSLLAILSAVRLIRDKLLGIEKRLRANEIALKSMRVLLSQVNVGLRAQLAAPGSPILRHMLDFYAVIDSRDESDEENRSWFVKRQTISGAGVVSDDAEYPELISARSWVDTTFSEGDVVLVRWDGTDGTDDYYSIIPVSGSSSSQQFKIVTIGGDWLSCHTYDGETEGEDEIIVAKNPDVRHIPSMLGISYSYTALDARTATAGVETENQVVTPPYFIGGLITAVACHVKVVGGWVDWVEVTGREYAMVVPPEE